MEMHETSGVVAAKGVVLIGQAGAEKATLTIGDAQTFESSLDGTFNALTLTSDNRADYLVFGVSNGTVGFYKPSSKVSSIAANKAFLNNTFGTSAVAMHFGGTIDGINHIHTNVSVEAPIYDLSGRKVANPVKGGVYIQNGHKFVK